MFVDGPKVVILDLFIYSCLSLNLWFFFAESHFKCIIGVYNIMETVLLIFNRAIKYRYIKYNKTLKHYFNQNQVKYESVKIVHLIFYGIAL